MDPRERALSVQQFARCQDTLRDLLARHSHEITQLAALESRLAVAQAEVNVARRAASNTHLLVETMRGIVDRERTRLFPQSNLPDDVLLVIFEHSRTIIPDVDPVTLDYHMLGSVTVARLAAVCKRWRRVALQAPHMWNIINIPPLNNPQCLIPKAYASKWVEERVQRSASAPLTIAFLLVDDPNDQVYADVLFALSRQAAQWSRLAVVCANPFPTLLKYLVGPLPMLTSILVGADSTADVFDPLKAWDPWFGWASSHDKPRVLGDAPALTCISFHGLPIGAWTPVPDAWQNVEWLDVAHDWKHPVEVLDILQHMPNLHSLRIEAVRSPQTNMCATKTRVTLSRLRKLVLSYANTPSFFTMSGPPPDAVFDWLDAPSVEHLVLQKLLATSPHLDRFVATLPMLNTVTLEELSFRHARDIPSVLRYAPLVDTLIIYRGALAPEFFQELSDSGHPLLPRLKRLDLREVPIIGTIGTRIAALVRIRAGSPPLSAGGQPVWARLKEFALDAESRMAASDRVVIQTVAEVEQGLVLHM